MEKSSEKLIRDISPKRNPFNQLLSDVQLKLSSHDQKKKKTKNIALEYDPYIDRDSYKESEAEKKEGTPKFKFPERTQRGKEQHLDVVINAPLQTKNSSNTVPSKQSKTREQLIGEWIAQYMEKKSLLGPHWQYKFKRHQYQVLQQAFMAIKYFNMEPNYTFNNFSKFYESKKMEIMVNVLKRCQQIKIKESFQMLVGFYKDQILFGLSQTIGSGADNKDHTDQSQLLKLDSDCGAHQKLVKSPQATKPTRDRKNSCGDISIDSHSYKLNSNKGSQPSEDLSALILNHNKLHLSGSLNNINHMNTSQPNIPKSKNSTSKNLTTNRDFGDLSLETNNKINSNRKLDNLPLDSRKNIVQGKFDRLKGNDSLVDRIDESSKVESSHPNVTITYILKNLDLKQINNMAADALKSKGEAQKIPDYINRVPIAESFYQPANKVVVPNQNQPMRNVFIQLFDHPHPQERRSISLQAKPQPRYISPDRGQQPNQIHQRVLNQNQYYPEDSSHRQSFRIMKQAGPSYPPEKPRAHSAAPKIRFTFTSGPPSPLPSSAASQQQANASKSNQINMGYQNPDCIKENSVLKLEAGKERSNLFGSEVSKNSLPQNSKMSRSKITHQQREHIKDIILPPAYDQYYTHHTEHQKPSRQQRPSNQQMPSSQQRPSVKIPFLSGSNTSTSPYSNVREQDPNILNNQFGIVVPRTHDYYQHLGRPFEKCQVGRAKSPKEKILVTCSSKGKI